MHTTLPRPPSVPLPIPTGSPLRTGWRATLVALLEEHGLVDVLDTVSAFAELAVRREPDTAEDPLDRGSVPTSELLPGRFERRTSALTDDHRGPFALVSRRRVADPALRRIEAIEIPRGPGRPRLDSNVDESLETPRRKVAS